MKSQKFGGPQIDFPLELMYNCQTNAFIYFYYHIAVTFNRMSSDFIVVLKLPTLNKEKLF